MTQPQPEVDVLVEEQVSVEEIMVDGEVVEVITDDVTTTTVVVDGEVVEILTDEILTDELVRGDEVIGAQSDEVVTDVQVRDGEVVAEVTVEEVVGVSFDRPGPTGDPRVDDAVARLDDLDAMPTSEHVAIVEDVHRRLQDALGDPAPDLRGGS